MFSRNAIDYHLLSFRWTLPGIRQGWDFKRHRFYVACLVCLMGASLDGQQHTLHLSEAFSLLEARHPGLSDTDLLDDIYRQRSVILDKGRLPEIILKSEGRLQTDSPDANLPPSVDFPLQIDVPLYSFRSWIEGSYAIFDGGEYEVKSRLDQLQKEMELQELEVRRYTLREGVIQLFVSIDLLREQAKLFDYSIDDLNTRLQLVAVRVEEGLVLPSEASKIRVKILQIEAEKEDVTNRHAGAVASLGQLLDIDLDKDLRLAYPSLPDAPYISKIHRPEQELFVLQRNLLLARSDRIDLRSKPRLSSFVQTGFGYPNPLNFLENQWSPFGILGLQFAWRLTDWDKDRREKELLKLESQKLDHALDAFEFNLNNKTAKYLSEEARIRNQIDLQTEIVALQKSILTEMAVQVDEGVALPSDYLLQVNAEMRVRQSIEILRARLHAHRLEFWNERGGDFIPN